jgi:hypothetical protein
VLAAKGLLRLTPGALIDVSAGAFQSGGAGAAGGSGNAGAAVSGSPASGGVGGEPGKPLLYNIIPEFLRGFFDFLLGGAGGDGGNGGQGGRGGAGAAGGAVGGGGAVGYGAPGMVSCGLRGAGSEECGQTAPPGAADNCGQRGPREHGKFTLISTCGRTWCGGPSQSARRTCTRARRATTTSARVHSYTLATAR